MAFLLAVKFQHLFVVDTLLDKTHNTYHLRYDVPPSTCRAGSLADAETFVHNQLLEFLFLIETLTTEQKSYLAKYMKGVSRSFSLVAPEVESPLNEYLAAAYLVCRVVDNIEDTVHPFEWQQARFAEFAELLAEPRQATAVLDRWGRLSWPGLTESEKEMMTSENGLTLWQIYTMIPDQYRRSIQHWAGVMAYGMERSGNPYTSDFFVSHGDVRLPIRESDYNLYCFYVAGTVGRMITELAVSFYNVNDAAAQGMAEGSEACGRALQKTNIVKDFVTDLQRGFSYLPREWMEEIAYAALDLSDVPSDWKKKVLLNVVAELEVSAQYVVSLPQTAVGYRRAGLLMMLPAYETILLAARRLHLLFTPDHAVKISRTKMGQCVLSARRMAEDNQAILAYAADMSQQIHTQLGVFTAAR